MTTKGLGMYTCAVLAMWLLLVPQHPCQGIDTLSVFVVCDYECVTKMKQLGVDPVSYLYDTFKIVDEIMREQLDLACVLVGMRAWYTPVQDPLDQSLTVMTDVLVEFGDWREDIQRPELWSDASVLLTARSLTSESGSPNGQFSESTMCYLDDAVGVIKYTGQPEATLASTMLHELGHGIGMAHDGGSCTCPLGIGNCLLHPTLNAQQVSDPTYSDCSLVDYSTFRSMDISSCLEVAPTEDEVWHASGISLCGNGILEDGEECDCGQVDSAACSCCDLSTCLFLAVGAECAYGDCCDTTTCSFEPSSVMCRGAGADACDVDDYCTGTSEQCEEMYQANMTACTDAGGMDGYCVGGTCNTYDVQCQAIWNSGYSIANDSCFDKTKDVAFNAGHCGQTADGNYLTCTDGETRNKYCGLLTCQYTGPSSSEDDVEFERMRIDNGLVPDYSCYSGRQLPFESVDRDQVMAMDGTRCAAGKACLDTDCVDISIVGPALAVSPSVSTQDICGDGKVTGSEECDCGPLECGCCNISTCEIKVAGETCAEDDCLACDGSTLVCTGSPMPNFVSCSSESTLGHCFNGECKSLNSACQRLFDENARVSSAMTYNNISSNYLNNGGGYLLYDSSASAWGNTYFETGIGNGYCGMLICENALGVTPSLIYNEEINEEVHITLVWDWGYDASGDTRVAYRSFENTLTNGIDYSRYLPIMADRGSPCETADSQPGYCETFYLRLDGGDPPHWFFRGECRPI